LCVFPAPLTLYQFKKLQPLSSIELAGYFNATTTDMKNNIMGK